MKRKGIFESFIDEIKDSLTISTTQSYLKKLIPRTKIPKNQFMRNGYMRSPDKGVDHFYEIDIEGNIAFYLVCDGRKSLDWILEDLTYKVTIEKSYINFELIVASKSIVFSFILDDIDSLYSLTRIVIQSNIMLYYLMEDKKKYIYLGYNEINVSKNIKEDIIRNINCEVELLEIEAKECP